MIHTVKGFGIVNKAEIDIFLELSSFFSDPSDVGNLISGSSAFSKTSLNIWKFSVHVLLKPAWRILSTTNVTRKLGFPLGGCWAKRHSHVKDWKQERFITTNKASGDDGIPVELFQFLKDDVVKALHSICQQIWKTHQWPQDWKRSVFIPIPKKRQCERMLKLLHNCTHFTR